MIMAYLLVSLSTSIGLLAYIAAINMICYVAPYDSLIMCATLIYGRYACGYTYSKHCRQGEGKYGIVGLGFLFFLFLLFVVTPVPREALDA